MPSFLDSVTITLCGKRAVADVIKLKVLKLLSWIIQMGIKYHHKSSYKRKVEGGTSLVVQLLRLQASTAGGTGSIAGQGSKIPHTTEHGQKERKKKKVGKGEIRPERRQCDHWSKMLSCWLWRWRREPKTTKCRKCGIRSRRKQRNWLPAGAPGRTVGLPTEHCSPVKSVAELLISRILRGQMSLISSPHLQ